MTADILNTLSLMSLKIASASGRFCVWLSRSFEADFLISIWIGIYVGTAVMVPFLPIAQYHICDPPILLYLSGFSNL